MEEEKYNPVFEEFKHINEGSVFFINEENNAQDDELKNSDLQDIIKSHNQNELSASEKLADLPVNEQFADLSMSDNDGITLSAFTARMLIAFAVVLSLSLSIGSIVLLNNVRNKANEIAAVDKEQVVVQADFEYLATVMKSDYVRKIIKTKEDYIYEAPVIAVDTTNTNTKPLVPKKVTISADGNVRSIYTVCDTVKEVLELASVSIGAEDVILNDYTGSTAVFDGMKIQVNRINTEYEYEYETISYTTEKRNNYDMNEGTTKVVREGRDGQEKTTYKVVKENGKVVSRELISTDTVVSAISKIIDVGTVRTFTNKDGKVIRYTTVYENARATSYTACFADTGKNPGDPLFGITASGAKARVGIVAVDRSLIPFGTEMYIEGIDFEDYGFCVAGDTGSSIKGAHVDLYFDTELEVYLFGSKRCNIYILKK